MPKLVFDIETIGEDFDKMDDATQEALTRWIEKGSGSDEEYKVKLQDLKEGLGFSPLTGEIVAIGALDVEQNKGAVYYQNPENVGEESEADGVKFKALSEADMLNKFWELAERYDEFISFNGRSFDVPWLMIRSAIHGIRPSKDLLSNRYTSLQKFGSKHIDLFDQLSFYGAVGIKSPKAEGVMGDDVAFLFDKKQYLKIAQYNVGDLRATRELYQKWEKYLKF